MSTPDAFKDALVGQVVKLNRKKAIIMGERNKFATVATLDGTMKVEFAWPVVAHIVKHGGKFKA